MSMKHNLYYQSSRNSYYRVRLDSWARDMREHPVITYVVSAEGREKLCRLYPDLAEWLYVVPPEQPRSSITIISLP